MYLDSGSDAELWSCRTTEAIIDHVSQPQDVIAVVSVLVAPLAALGGAWLNGYLGRARAAITGTALRGTRYDAG
jgi:hypothetical protein